MTNKINRIDQVVLDFAVQDLSEGIINTMLNNEKFQKFFFTLSEQEAEDFQFELEDCVECWMDVEGNELCEVDEMEVEDELSLDEMEDEIDTMEDV